jgi:hypothetical protein
VKNEKDFTQTNKLLKKLEMQGLVTKVDRGRYIVNVVPENFQLFNYLATLREKVGKDIPRADVGGFLWKESNVYFMGMPEEALDLKIMQALNQILAIRVSKIFEAYRAIAAFSSQKRAGKKGDMRLFEPLIREAYLEVIPYYLGSQSGMDHDGLTQEELEIVTKKIIEAIPEEIGPQVYSGKNEISEHVKAIEGVFNQIIKNVVDEPDIEEELKTIEENEAFNDFVLIVTRPDFMIDAQWEENRDILEHVKELNEGYTPLESAYFLTGPCSEPIKIKNIIKNWGSKYVTQSAWESLIKTYDLLTDACHIADNIRIIETVEGSNERLREDIREETLRLIRKHDAKDIIPLLAFTDKYTNWVVWIHNLPKSTEILLKYFEGEPRENIEEWLEKGKAEREAFTKKCLTSVE